MEPWQWALAALAGLSAVFVMGSIIWAVFDVLRDPSLSQTARIIWVLVLFVVPLLGLMAWLYAKPGLRHTAGGVRLRKTL
ncbi:Phospholipase_D-nuclease N-terminal [Arthrobacter sp. yr096]|uniref:PLDc N-terminal domain-containing protein n=1 Tax=Arthrobacter sp. yr096 TaxID=1761750 RepID=UPI0008B552EC|nr:PLDc N-terminal domain-containing protein [Arthrobacter sp. yr096]SEI77021.1 Phospholipase_D-nuclease N-terminal [Arthrobacter sp. yr096]